jgi:hypothetical protein
LEWTNSNGKGLRLEKATDEDLIVLEAQATMTALIKEEHNVTTLLA